MVVVLVAGCGLRVLRNTYILLTISRPLLYIVCFSLIVGQLCAQSHRLERTHPAMGTLFRIIVYAEDTVQAHRACRQAFARIDSLEQMMSDYRRDSEINRLTAETGWTEVSPELWQVLRTARRISRRSGGAFDITIGPLSKLWRRAFRQQLFPERDRIEAALKRVDYRKLRVHPRRPRIYLHSTNIQLDLGGIAKGYALDQAGQTLQQYGLSSFLLDGGGDLLLGAPPPDASGWRVGALTTEGEETALPELSYCSIATSGSTYRYLEWKGSRYSHIIDPRTGVGVQHNWQVTVVAPCAALADALASACSVLGKEQGKRLVSRFAGCSVSFR